MMCDNRNVMLDVPLGPEGASIYQECRRLGMEVGRSPKEADHVIAFIRELAQKAGVTASRMQPDDYRALGSTAFSPRGPLLADIVNAALVWQSAPADIGAAEDDALSALFDACTAYLGAVEGR